jgi:hypothetical protein
MDYTYMWLEVESYVPRLIVPILNLPCEKRFVSEINFLEKYTYQIGYLASSDKVGRTPISGRPTHFQKKIKDHGTILFFVRLTLNRSDHIEIKCISMLH